MHNFVHGAIVLASSIRKGYTNKKSRIHHLSSKLRPKEINKVIKRLLSMSFHACFQSSLQTRKARTLGENRQTRIGVLPVSLGNSCLSVRIDWKAYERRGWVQLLDSSLFTSFLHRLFFRGWLQCCFETPIPVFFLSNIFVLIVLFLKKSLSGEVRGWDLPAAASNGKCSNAARHPGGTAMRIERSRSQS